MTWYHVTGDDAGPHREWEIEAPSMDEALSYATTILRTDWQGPAHLVVSRWRDLQDERPAKRLELLEELMHSVARWSADGHDRRLPGVLEAFNAVVALDNEGE